MKNVTVGDCLAPALPAEGAALAASASAKAINAEAAPKPPVNLKISSISAVLANDASSQLPVGSCKQVLWFSFFFDGTGNNLDADVDSGKHSNVAKLFRAHRGTENIGGRLGFPETDPGIYRIYIPGVGTYFPEIKDDGGMAGGGFGRYGDQRIVWALAQLEKLAEKHIKLAQAPSNQIIEMNITAFGFSRGAALARAFIHDLLTDHCEKQRDSTFNYKKGKCRLRVRFMGLFDTVASSGLAASTNNVNLIDAGLGTARTHVWARVLLHSDTRADVLAFARQGKPGADPSPGIWDGHKAFGSRLFIHPMVEDVRHFVAAHEYRNSFPLDSLSYRLDNSKYSKPTQFHEYVYPGVHSDVGGSYRPGEGGRNIDGATKLGLIPLHSMYEFALKNGKVPFRAVSAFRLASKADFAILPEVKEDFNYYSSKVPKLPGLGELFNAHMALYYQWRFHAIRRKLNQDTASNDAINRNAAVFSAEERALEAKIKPLEDEYEKRRKAVIDKSAAISRLGMGAAVPAVGKKLMDDLQAAIAAEKTAHAALMPWKAKLGALPKETKLADITDFYDKQLMDDAKSIIFCMGSSLVSVFRASPNINYASLRPHYRVLVDAYRNEFELNKGLRDRRIIAFFDKYVHDSLSAFAKDSTLPSDPRIIYTGGDEKLPYASKAQDEHDDADRSKTRMA